MLSFQPPETLSKGTAMKLFAVLSLATVLTASSHAVAQNDGMKGMSGMKDTKNMKGMSDDKADKATVGMTHQADGAVKNVDAAKGIVTLSHEPVKSLGWPAMSMGFAVKDKSMLEKLAVGQKVHVQFKKQGEDYVITSVR
jgi:Cu(I)/Ag(I) efflux system protein CusF